MTDYRINLTSPGTFAAAAKRYSERGGLPEETPLMAAARARVRERALSRGPLVLTVDIPEPLPARTMLTYTIVEAARELRKSRRWLQDWLRDHPFDAHGRPFFSKNGRTKVFRETDIARILDETMRAAAPCPSSSSTPAKARARTTRSAAPTSDSTYTRLAALTGDQSLLNSSRTSKDRSSAGNGVARLRVVP
jgi:hypothetical protein